MKNNKLTSSIPIVDLDDFENGNKKHFVEQLGKAYSEVGFVAVKNHYLTKECSDRLYQNVKTFFSLPDTVKSTYEFPELFGQRGYVGKGKEHAKGRDIGDLKEFFHFGQNEKGNPYKEDYPENVDVIELPDFLASANEAFSALEKTGLKMLKAIALFLNLEENYFDSKVRFGNSILRPIHYFPINPNSVEEGAVRAAEHGDINLITLLMGASAAGLEILSKEGTWVPVTAIEDHLIVNVGDMLERHTNNRLRSTIHRVVNPPKEKLNTSRFSIPFFMHPHGSMDLSCLPSCIDADNPKHYDNITAGEFLEQRLAEIGLKK